MKKLITILGLAALMLLAKPQQSEAAPGCVAYWSPLTLFFQVGGTVYVTHPDGSDYAVNGANVISGAQYGLQNGDSIIIYPPDCNKWGWGWFYFCPCNDHGGVDCGAPQALQVGSAVFLHETFWEQCNCPNGSSDAGFHFVFQKYCSAPPPSSIPPKTAPTR